MRTGSAWRTSTSSIRLPSSAKPRTAASSASASSGSSTLIVVMPMARAGLRFTPRSSRNTASCGRRRRAARTPARRCAGRACAALRPRTRPRRRTRRACPSACGRVVGLRLARRPVVRERADLQALRSWIARDRLRPSRAVARSPGRSRASARAASTVAAGRRRTRRANATQNSSKLSSLRSSRAQAPWSALAATTPRMKRSGSPCSRSYAANTSNGDGNTTPPRSKITARERPYGRRRYSRRLDRPGYLRRRTSRMMPCKRRRPRPRRSPGRGLVVDSPGSATRLTEAEWKAPTECPGWSVQDNLAHIIGDRIDDPRPTGARGRGHRR